MPLRKRPSLTFLTHNILDGWLVSGNESNHICLLTGMRLEAEASGQAVSR